MVTRTKESTAEENGSMPAKKKQRPTDPTLLLCAKVDRLLADVPAWGMRIILNFLCEKHGFRLVEGPIKTNADKMQSAGA